MAATTTTMHAGQDIESQQECHRRRLRAHLLARIAGRYNTVTEAIKIGRLTFPFTRVKEPDTVLDQIVEQEDLREKLSGVRRAGDELHLPYWAELWESASGLGAFLMQHGTTHKRSPGLQAGDQSALDLGCGMGLAGLAAASLGMRVTLADLEAPALLFARLNTLPYAARVRVRRLDWRRDALDETFDLILGADVLYDRAQWEFLEPFWRAHLKPHGSVLLGEPGRQTGDLFPEWIAARGWSLERFEQPVPTRERPIRIFVAHATGP